MSTAEWPAGDHLRICEDMQRCQNDLDLVALALLAAARTLDPQVRKQAIDRAARKLSSASTWLEVARSRDRDAG
jgi:hypothetical protein